MSEEPTVQKTTEEKLTDIICNIPLLEWECGVIFAEITNSNYEFKTKYNKKNMVTIYLTTLIMKL